jgi:hypothetical protein
MVGGGGFAVHRSGPKVVLNVQDSPFLLNLEQTPFQKSNKDAKFTGSVIQMWIMKMGGTEEKAPACLKGGLCHPFQQIMNLSYGQSVTNSPPSTCLF